MQTHRLAEVKFRCCLPLGSLSAEQWHFPSALQPTAPSIAPAFGKGELTRRLIVPLFQTSPLPFWHLSPDTAQ